MKRESVVVLAAVVFLLPLHFLSRSQALFKPVESDKVVGGSEVDCNSVIQYIGCAENACDYWADQASCNGECGNCSLAGETFDAAMDRGHNNWADVDFQSIVPVNGGCGLMSGGDNECEWKDGACSCPVEMYDEHALCPSQRITIFNTDCIPSNPPPPEPWPWPEDFD